MSFIESIARTNKLYCTKCGIKIKKGDDVIFETEHNKMKRVFCENCKSEFEMIAIDNDIHPFSSEGLGQE